MKKEKDRYVVIWHIKNSNPTSLGDRIRLMTERLRESFGKDTKVVPVIDAEHSRMEVIRVKK